MPETDFGLCEHVVKLLEMPETVGELGRACSVKEGSHMTHMLAWSM